ncbi:MAG: hypothetical protein QW727_01830 [Candidatus Pacearchaeota archaeon]
MMTKKEFYYFDLTKKQDEMFRQEIRVHDGTYGITPLIDGYRLRILDGNRIKIIKIFRGNLPLSDDLVRYYTESTCKEFKLVMLVINKVMKNARVTDLRGLKLLEEII